MFVLSCWSFRLLFNVLAANLLFRLLMKYRPFPQCYRPRNYAMAVSDLDFASSVLYVFSVVSLLGHHIFFMLGLTEPAICIF